MAPITRSGRTPSSDVPQQVNREASWQFVGSETRSEREVSEPASSYDEEADARSGYGEKIEYGEDSDYAKQVLEPLAGPEDREDILHPLREAANRVGREVERFAELLDGYNPLTATAQDEKYEMTIDLIDRYHGIALDTVQRLREQHSTEKQKKDGRRWKKKVRGFSLADDDDEMDIEDIEDHGTPFPNSQTTLDDLERWEQEAQTWDLLKRLVHLRFPPPGSSVAGTSNNEIHRYSSEREIWETFLETNDLALERKTVLQWLKDTAEESGDDIDDIVQDLQQNAERGDLIAHGWLHTKAAIKNQKRIHVWPQALDPSSPEVRRVHLNATRTEPLVTQLDPDAPHRQKRKLEVQDEYFERSIWLGCYEMLRRGRSSTEIKEWCTERTEVWRAVSMSGLPDEEGEDEDDGTPGSSALWRRMCFALARKADGDKYQCAVYGILSGDISSVEPVCNSWDDFIFVNYNALLRTQFDNYLQTTYPERSVPLTNSNFGAFDAVQFHGDPKTSASRLVETLKSNPRTKAETLQPLKMLQGVLIGNQFENFIYQQGLALSKFANANGTSTLIPVRNVQPENEHDTKYITLDDHDSLRVLTHVLLVFMGLGMDLGGYTRETEVENVIVAYISFLRLAGKEELIPLYSSQLTGARKYAVLSRNLIDVTNHDQRVMQINLMRELGLDVQEFVRMQARFLLDDFEDMTKGYPASDFTFIESVDTPTGTIRRVKRDFIEKDGEADDRIDLLLIRSLEWYLLVDGLWSETFTVGTILYLRFYKHMHLASARLLAGRVESASIARIKTRAILGESFDFIGLEAGDDEDLTEVLDGSADKKRQMKKFMLAEARSFRELEVFTEHLDHIETITGISQIMERPDPNTDLRSMRQELARAMGPTRLTAQSILKGWLLTSQKEETVQEFAQLREAYLCDTILAYIHILIFGGSVLTRDFLLECMDLSALIADESSDLLQLFIKMGRLEELVELLAIASRNLLQITSSKQAAPSRSKKLRQRGWTQELWSVRQ